MGSDSQQLDLIVPCYNPVGDWEQNLLKSFRAFEEMLAPVKVGLVLVNDGSTLNVTPAQIDFLKTNLPDLQYLSYTQNRGKGFALRHGVETANAGLYLFTDIDFPYRLESMQKVFASLQKGKDVALGFRKADYYTQVPLFRKALSKSLRWVLKNLLRLAITDTQCGLKGFNDEGKAIFLSTKIDRFLFDLEYVKKVSATQLSLEAVPVQLREEVTFSKMNLRVLFSELFNFFVLLVRRQ